MCVRACVCVQVRAGVEERVRYAMQRSVELEEQAALVQRHHQEESQVGAGAAQQ